MESFQRGLGGSDAPLQFFGIIVIFKFKQKTIVIDVITDCVNAFEVFFPTPAVKFIPDWFKTLPKRKSMQIAKDSSLRKNMSSCPAIPRLYSMGHIIPMWSDVLLNVSARQDRWEDNRVSYVFSDGKSRIDFHHPDQHKGFLGSSATQLKFLPPWVFRTKSNTKFFLTGCPWSYTEEQPFHVLHSPTEYKLNYTCAINGFVEHKEKDREVFIPCGSPMAHFFPLSDEKVVIKKHLVSSAEYNTYFNVNAGSSSASFVNGYQKCLKYIRRMNDV